MTLEKNLVLEARININSGEMIIVDPCYLEDFDMKEIEELDNIEEERAAGMIEHRYRQAMNAPKLTGVLQSLKERLEKGEEFTDKEIEDLREASSETVKKLERMDEPLHPPIVCFRPPYLFQSREYVAFRNPIGDGDYPVVRTSKGLNLIFNYMVKGDGDLSPDLSKLHGEHLGQAPVDSGMHIIANANRFKLEQPDRDDLYCKVKVPNGKYVVRFDSRGDRALIRRQQ